MTYSQLVRHLRRNRAQHLRHQQSHPAVADDRHTRLRIDGHLLEDSARGRDRLGKYGRLVVHGFRNRVQVDRRQRQVFGKRAVALANAYDIAVSAMLLDSARAPVAVPAPDVDFANDNLNSRLETVLPASGAYTIVVGDVGSDGGEYELILR